MLKIQNEKGETVFVVEDEAIKPRRVIELKDDRPCSKCKQSGPGKTGEYPCPVCGRNLLHDEDANEYEEEKE